MTDKVLITCDDDNIGSSKIIEKNGGILENEVEDEVGLTASGVSAVAVVTFVALLIRIISSPDILTVKYLFVTESMFEE
mgnify:CR=1 FL=1